MKVVALIFSSLLMTVQAVAGQDVGAVFAAFLDAGLEAEQVRTMEPSDYGMAPYVCEGRHFLIPSLCDDCGGRVFACPNAEDLGLLKQYYDALGRVSAALFSWTFEHGAVLVQINGDLPRADAERYKAALESVSE